MKAGFAGLFHGMGPCRLPAAPKFADFPAKSLFGKSDGAARRLFPAPGASKTLCFSWPDARHRAGVFS